jgi:signal transduction histidine kinase
MTARRHVTPGDAALLRGTRWRLIAWSAGSTLVVLIALGALLYATVAGSLAADSRETLLGRAAALGRAVAAAAFAPPFPVGGAIAIDESRPGFVISGPASGTLAMVVPPNGHVIGPPGVSGQVVADADLAAAREGQTVVREGELAGSPFRLVVQPVERPDGVWLVAVSGDRTAELRTVNVLLAVLGVGGLAVLAASFVFGAMYADRALIPIREALRRQREFAADASHELRTPLAIVRGTVEHLRRHGTEPVASVGDSLDDLEAETARLTALVEDLLLLARTDSGAVDLERAPTDLAGVVLDASGPLGGMAAERGIRIEVDAAPAPIVGDPARLGQMATILIDNAVRHAPAGSTVRVAVAADRPAPGARLTVDDDGPGIRPDDLPRLFDRFYRASGAPAGGTGLGLAIARWIVDRHGGSIEAANLPSGGARFLVRLPAR